jgi:hypothetical protein
MNLALWANNLLEPRIGGVPCAGDSNYVNGGGTNDAPEIQARMDAAVSAPGVSIAEILAPSRVYRINSTLTVPVALIARGLGGRGGGSANTAQPPTIVWNGAAGGTMLDVAAPVQNIPMTAFVNLCLTGRTDGVNRPGIGIRFRGTEGFQGAIDTGTLLDNVWLQNIDTPLSIEGGCTNFIINGGRIDGWSNYGIDVAGLGASITICGNHTMAMDRACTGMIRLATTDSSVLKLYGLHLEGNANADLNETFAGGANPFDKRGLIRLVVDVSKPDVQHRVYFDGLQLAEAFGVPSHSLFQVTGTSSDGGLDTAKMFHIHGNLGMGLERGTGNSNVDDEIRILGGNLHASVRPPLFASGNFDEFRYGIGKVGGLIQSWSNVPTAS